MYKETLEGQILVSIQLTAYLYNQLTKKPLTLVKWLQVKNNGTILGQVNSPPIFEPICVGTESDVHQGYDLGFDPWPNLGNT